MVRTVGVILAGGRSSRMGSDKAAVVVGSHTMLHHTATALRAVTDELVVAGRDETVGGIPAVADPGAAHRGPLAGLAAASSVFPNALLVVVAVDQPWVRTETLRRLVALTGELPVLPVDGGVRQTTCAVYPARALDHVGEELTAGGSIQSLVDRISFLPVTSEEWTRWGEDGRSWYSADTMAAITLGLERYGAP